MPSYTFRCEHCGEFTLFFRSMKKNKGSADCPECGLEARRVFMPPHLSSMPNALKTRIERGMEPRRMTREELGTRMLPKKGSPVANRPWQA